MSCCELENKTCYNSIDELLRNNSLITLCGEQLELSKKVVLDNLHNVGLIGSKGGTNITCAKNHDSGFQIITSRGIELKNIRLINCGTLYNSTSLLNYRDTRKFMKFICSLHITNSTDIAISNVSILNSNGTGLVMINSYGSITGCKFQENKVTDSQLGSGGGMYVEMNSPSENSTASYLKIYQCSFLHNNVASLPGKSSGYVECNDHSKSNTFGRGGGVAVFLTGSAMDNTIVVEDVYVTSNEAIWGGGMYVHVCNTATRNHILFRNVILRENKCELYGGGGIDIGFTLVNNLSTADNSVDFDNCTFQQNRAFFGGGVALYSSESDRKMNNSVTFSNCIWQENIAYYGSALDIAPQLIATPTNGDQPKITFKNVTVRSNTRHMSTYNEIHSKNILTRKRLGPGRGTFIVAGQTIMFEGTVEFSSNMGSAVYAVSSILEFAPGTNATFTNNSGLNGGAIALIGYSALKLTTSITVSMFNNSAALGGAIYHESFDKHDYLFSHNCFLQGRHNDSVLFQFEDNRAGHADGELTSNITEVVNGNDMYVITLLPCMEYCKSGEGSTPSEIFSCIGDFQFQDSCAVATSGAYFSYNVSEPLHIIPGKRTEIQFELLDDLDQIVDGIYHITTSTDSVYIDDVHTYTSGNLLALGGLPGTEGNITINKIVSREVILSVEVVLEECPPFFLYDPNQKVCSCAVTKESDYKNIHICNKSSFESELLHGYWVGYDNINRTAESFVYGICPPKYCFEGNESERFHMLPANSEVEDFVCGNTRAGILCGQCRSGYCAQYHTQTFECGSCDKCKNGVGWVLYVITELIPVTLIFLVIIMFDISFTSGYLNGFIFFSQIFDSVFSIGTGFVFFPISAYKLNEAILIIYKLFNFDILGNNHLSFCLWKEATTIQLMSFKFLTVAYAAILVIVTVFVTKRCASSRKFLCCTKPASMIHGLSAFLVMVYTQCTNISFQLLNYVWVKDLNGTARRVLFYQGGITLFSKEHAPFAVGAITCLSTLTLLPPLLLMSYPLCYRIAALLRLDNTRFSSFLGTIFPLSKLKPVFDSFQGCFKDNYRHFAGLYFVYRVGLLASVLTSEPVTTYAFTQIQLSLILTIHCICWPYVKRLHNIIDALFFLNCSLINVITIVNFYYGLDDSIHQSTIDVLAYIQLLFVYAPFVYLIAFTLYSILKLCSAKKRNSSQPDIEDEIMMERLELSEEKLDISNSYNKIVDTY